MFFSLCFWWVELNVGFPCSMVLEQFKTQVLVDEAQNENVEIQVFILLSFMCCSCHCLDQVNLKAFAFVFFKLLSLIL
jgi:hypothetical protein